MRPAGLSILRWVAESAASLCGMNCRRILTFPNISAQVVHLTGRMDRYLVVPGSSAMPFPCFIEDKKELIEFFGEWQATEKFNRLPRRRLRGISGIPGDRKAVFDFGARADKGADDELRLVLHLMGEPLSLLVDPQGMIQETGRPTKRFPVGAEYAPPTPPKLANPLTITFPEFLQLRRSVEAMALDEFLCQKIWGIDEETATVMVRKAGGNAAPAESSDVRLWEVFFALKTAVRDFLNPAYRLQTDPDTGLITDWLPIDQEAAGRSVNQIFAARSQESAQDEGRDKTVLGWRKFTSVQLKKVKAAQKTLVARKAEAEKAELFKEYADILNINRHQISRGASQVELSNPYAENTPVSIKLDPAKSLQENIELYYKKHRRARAAQGSLVTEEQRLERASNLLRNIGEAVKDEDITASSLPIEEWCRELTDLGLRAPRPAAASGKPTEQRRLPYREFTLDSGEIIWVGRSARDNDVLTSRLAAKSDWFFHARQGPGAHVILRQEKNEPPPATAIVQQVAAIAAFFSEAKHSSLVPVAYTPIKYVRKSRKAPPGMVNLLREETIMVEPAPPPRYHDRRESR